jgi:hypothetical protein
LALALGPAIAGTGCFDFDTRAASPAPIERRIPAAFREPLPTGERGPHLGSGQSRSGVNWAVARGRTPRPLAALMADLTGHEATRSREASRIAIAEISDPRYWRRQRVQFGIDPFPLMHVDWAEDWAFALEPSRGSAWYEKIEGTAFISWLCGVIQVSATPGGGSELLLYEESRATARDETAARKTVAGAFERLASGAATAR